MFLSLMLMRWTTMISLRSYFRLYTPAARRGEEEEGVQLDDDEAGRGAVGAASSGSGNATVGGSGASSSGASSSSGGIEGSAVALAVAPPPPPLTSEIVGGWWGRVRVTAMRPGMHGREFGGYQARCPWRRKNTRTELQCAMMVIYGNLYVLI